MDFNPTPRGAVRGEYTEIMRTIKFRAYVYCPINEKYEIRQHESIENNCGAFFFQPEKYTPNPHIIMQFTGLYDKNEREIYEGDVVRVDCSPVGGSFEDGVYVVAYILPDCAYCLESVDKKSTIQFNECYVYEVIGNIHENHELLNQ